jgi:hypothetical protein
MGRGRLNSHLQVVPEDYPRAMVVTSGEDIPRGFSGASRILEVGIGRGDVFASKLTEIQAAGQRGELATGTGEVVKWLLADLEARTAAFHAREQQVLAEFLKSNRGHLRTPSAIASLQAAVELLFKFAVETGVISGEERAEMDQSAAQALAEVGRESLVDRRVLGPSARFVALLAGVLAGERGHLILDDGTPPPNPRRFGWRLTRGECVPCGDRLGVVKGLDAFIKLDPALEAVRRLAQGSGDPFEISARTLTKRLHEDGKLAGIQRSAGAGDTVYLVKISVLGVRSGGYLHMHTADLLGGETEASDTAGPKPPFTLDELEGDDESTIQ